MTARQAALLRQILFALIALVILATFALVLVVAADTPNSVFLPALRKPEQYPTTGWVITARWGNNSQTFFTLVHPAGGWSVTGACIDNQYPAPTVGDSCTLVNAIFYCGSSAQRISILELLVTPTATATSTATPTELPTETPEPTLHPPTGITDTPTPEG